MSLQWTLTAGFLYVEIGIVLLLVLPIASSRRWNSLFKAKFVQDLQQQARSYFMILLAILVLVFLNAIREMNKYSHPDFDEHTHLDREMQGSMRLFRAQRNFYISGSALFLSLVIRRLGVSISTQAIQTQSVVDQGKEITTLKSKISDLENELKLEKKEHDRLTEEYSKQENVEITTLKSKISDLENKLKLEKKEHDRLTEEYSKLEKQFLHHCLSEIG